MNKEVITLMDKIKIATELYNTSKDYLELLKVSPKLKQTFNKQVIDEQISLNEAELKKLADSLQDKPKSKE